MKSWSSKRPIMPSMCAKNCLSNPASASEANVQSCAGVQDRTDLHLYGRLGAPVGDQFHPVLLIRVGCLADVQPSEGLQAEIDHDVESLAFIGSDDRIHSGRKVRAPLPVSEEVDVFAGPVDDAVRRDRVPSRQGETER